MSKNDFITIKGARQNNLRNVNTKIPKNKLVVITGVSGSGKSSLAFDTLYAEGYRRYVENLSSSARFFLGAVKKPKVERIDNLSPAIAIDQKSDTNNPRSTVGTLTDIYNFLRFLFSGLGKPHCPNCDKELEKQDAEGLVRNLRKMENGTHILILATWQGKQETFSQKINAISAQGFSKVRIFDRVLPIEKARENDNEKQKNIQVVVDRMTLLSGKFDRERIVDSLQTAAKIGKGKAKVVIDGEEELNYSKHYHCASCGYVLREITARNFSFNSPFGACSACSGLGVVFQIDEKKVIPNWSLSINEGAILPWSRAGGRMNGCTHSVAILKALSKKHHFSLNVPIKKISKDKIKKILHGDEEGLEIKTNRGKKKTIIFEGLAKELEDKHKNADSSFVRNEIEKYLSKKTCPVCQGKRLKKEYLAVRVFDKTIDQIVEMELKDLVKFLAEKSKNKNSKSNGTKQASDEMLSEIISRIKPLLEVGLDYLDLDRSIQTLSGGEYQRVRLAIQLYSGLSNVIYVLDEPSVGLHPRDTKKLIGTLRKLQKQNNTIVVVEHDRDIIKAADYLIDVGPGAGDEGGKIIFEGNLGKLKRAKTETARYLSRRKDAKKKIRKISKQQLTICGAKHNNLKNINVNIPLNNLVTVAGVSGGGKSSLVIDILAKALRKKIHKATEEPGLHDRIKNIDSLAKVIVVNQKPIGRSPRSNAATYTGVFNYVRKLFASTELAQKKKFTASHFSFNMRGGRCEYCQGEGVRKIEMHLLDNVYANCPHCQGNRYNKKMLAVQYHGANIVDVLGMSVDYAYHFFSSHNLISQKLSALRKVGLGYLRLGQSATELSGGEAQRIKLASELSRKSNGNALYVLDEPTVGLHFSDICQLLKVLNELVENGNSVVVIEHNADVINFSDHVIELGPEGGNAGGEVVFEGTPEKLKKAKTWTGKTLS